MDALVFVALRTFVVAVSVLMRFVVGIGILRIVQRHFIQWVRRSRVETFGIVHFFGVSMFCNLGSQRVTLSRHAFSDC